MVQGPIPVRARCLLLTTDSGGSSPPVPKRPRDSLLVPTSNGPAAVTRHALAGVLHLPQACGHKAAHCPGPETDLTACP